MQHFSLLEHVMELQQLQNQEQISGSTMLAPGNGILLYLSRVRVVLHLLSLGGVWLNSFS